jgi:hypothetical protein
LISFVTVNLTALTTKAISRIGLITLSAIHSTSGRQRLKARLILPPLAAPHGRESDWKADDWRQPQKQSEGKCYTITNDLAAKNSYTSAKGTKHD